jgi:hypothetical protein
MRKSVASYTLRIKLTYFAIAAMVVVGPLLAFLRSSDGGFQNIIFALVIVTPISIWLHKKFQAFVDNPVDEALRKYGNVDEVERDINTDFRGHENFCRRLCAAKRWVCGVYQRNALVLPLKEIVWVYSEQVGSGRWLDRPGSGLTVKYQIVFWTRQRSGFAIRVPRRDVDSALALLSAAAPWINIGYTDDLKESWDVDVNEFIYLVEQRRSLIESQASSLK